jgi:hypothetical protein
VVGDIIVRIRCTCSGDNFLNLPEEWRAESLEEIADRRGMADWTDLAGEEIDLDGDGRDLDGDGIALAGATLLTGSPNTSLALIHLACCTSYILLIFSNFSAKKTSVSLINSLRSSSP